MDAPKGTVLLELDVLVLVELTKTRRTRVKKLGDLVGRIAHGETDPDTLAGATLLSEAKLGPVLRFHVDDLKDDAEPWMMGHFSFRAAKADDASPEAKKLRKAGHTTESVANAMTKVFGKAKIPMQVEFHGRKASAELGVPLAGVVLVGGVPLEHVGTEFERRAGSGSGPVSVRTKRHRDGHLEFWLRYRITDVWKADLCEQENKRANAFLSDLLTART